MQASQVTQLPRTAFISLPLFLFPAIIERCCDACAEELSDGEVDVPCMPAQVQYSRVARGIPTTRHHHRRCAGYVQESISVCPGREGCSQQVAPCFLPPFCPLPSPALLSLLSAAFVVACIYFRSVESLRIPAIETCDKEY
jgi:hypothetical protein